MIESHTRAPWDSDLSTEDYQGHLIFGNDRTVAATHTEKSTHVTPADVANMSLVVAAPAMLSALRRIAREADFRQEDGAMALGQRLIDIERDAKAAIAAYESRIVPTTPGET